MPIITPTSLTCNFINQSKDIEKSCEIKYGPATPGCKNLTSSYLEAASDSNNIEIPLDISADNFCFVVKAGNGTKTVIIEGRSSGIRCQF